MYFLVLSGLVIDTIGMRLSFNLVNIYTKLLNFFYLNVYL